MAKDLRPLGDPGSRSFQVDRYPFYQLNRLVSRYNSVIEAELRRIRLDIPTWRVLMILGEQEPRPIGQIAKLAVINISTLMRIVERMHKADLIKSAASATDGRITELSLTAKGRTALATARKVTAPIYQRLIRGFSATDFSHLLDLLNRLYGNLE
ncbi:MAG TPA: MarR family winged helix-turn-helix transcriptional regulator [Steroidobacter sp.]|uniref:MarR family winged helix-turn-helix transcriptional regulator n=1 Tax=Steroidobacter sp. TaxID=1978227 RepID=UPI002EDB47F3